MKRCCEPDCPKRSIYCHSTCETYIKFKEENQKVLEAKKMACRRDSAIVDAIGRMHKQKPRKRR